MERNFAKSLKLVLKYEGGYINNPKDPGGATNKGVTLATFRRYVKPGGTVADLKAITDAQLATVYRKQYWDAVKGDTLPAGMDFATFDFAVNSGPMRARNYAADNQTIDDLCDARLAFMKRAKDKKGRLLWPTFGKGWQRRLDDVRKNAKAMAASTKRSSAATIPALEPKPSPAPLPVIDKELIRRVQTGLALLNYQPGGADGVIGPLTAGAIRIFRADNNLPDGDGIDEALITALASAKPREMVPARANATATEVTTTVPEARHNWLSKITAGGLGGTAGAGVLVDGVLKNVTDAKSYVNEFTDYLGTVPGWAWCLVILAVAGFIYWKSQQSENASVAAFQAGDRR